MLGGDGGGKVRGGSGGGGLPIRGSIYSLFTSFSMDFSFSKGNEIIAEFDFDFAFAIAYMK